MVPLNDLSFTLIYTLAGFFQGLIYGYFLHYYLEPKYGNKSFLYYYLTYPIYMCVILFVIYSEPYLRIFFTIFYLTLCAFLFYTGKKSRVLLTGIYLYTLSGIAEVVSQFMAIFIFGYDIIEELPDGFLSILLIIGTLVLLITIHAFLKFTRKSLDFNNKFSNIFIALSINNLFISIILSLGFYFNGLLSYYTLGEYFIKAIVIIGGCAMGTLLLDIYIAYSLSKLKHSMAKELLIQSMHQENIKQLEYYLENKNNHYTTLELRHDIMNYLQTIKTIKEQDNHG